MTEGVVSLELVPVGLKLVDVAAATIEVAAAAEESEESSKLAHGSEAFALYEAG